MKAASLLFLRISTGLLVILWGVFKVMNPKSAIGISESYYGGTLSAEAMQMPLGILQILIGVLVILGLIRKIVYPVQALILCFGALAVWKFLLDPLGLYLLDKESSTKLFFPSLGMAAATLVLLAFKDEDTLSLDAKLARRKT